MKRRRRRLPLSFRPRRRAFRRRRHYAAERAPLVPVAIDVFIAHIILQMPAQRLLIAFIDDAALTSADGARWLMRYYY
jgi:hypothetical protein